MKKRGYVRPLTGFTADPHAEEHRRRLHPRRAQRSCCGFALIWHIWWLAARLRWPSLAAIIGHTFNYHRDYYIPADEVVRTEGVRTRLLAAACLR